MRRSRVFKIAIVDADNAGFSGEGAVEFSGCVNFHDRLHADLTAERDEVAKKFIAESGDDEQEAVGVVRPRFPNLPSIEDEVLAKHGKFDGFARIAEIFQRAAKEFSLGKDREHGGACCFQRLGQLDRLERVAENSFRGRSGLQLCDNIQGVARESGRKITKRSCCVHTVAKRRFRKDAFAVVYLKTARLQDAVEDGATVSLSARSHCFVC